MKEKTKPVSDDQSMTRIKRKKHGSVLLIQKYSTIVKKQHYLHNRLKGVQLY